MGMEVVIAIGGVCAALMAIIGLIKFIITPIRKMLRTLEAWAGEPAMPGVPARPGVLERLASIEHELKTNGGSSLKDSAYRTEQRLVDIDKRLASVEQVVTDVKDQTA